MMSAGRGHSVKMAHYELLKLLEFKLLLINSLSYLTLSNLVFVPFRRLKLENAPHRRDVKGLANDVVIDL